MKVVRYLQILPPEALCVLMVARLTENCGEVEAVDSYNFQFQF
jgi:hypothetical protein